MPRATEEWLKGGRLKEAAPTQALPLATQGKPTKALPLATQGKAACYEGSAACYDELAEDYKAFQHSLLPKKTQYEEDTKTILWILGEGYEGHRLRERERGGGAHAG